MEKSDRCVATVRVLLQGTDDLQRQIFDADVNYTGDVYHLTATMMCVAGKRGIVHFFDPRLVFETLVQGFFELDTSFNLV